MAEQARARAGAGAGEAMVVGSNPALSIEFFSSTLEKFPSFLAG